MLSNQVTIDFVLCSVVHLRLFVVVFFFKQKTAYELRISDWSSDVCSSDLTDAEKKEIRKDQADCMGCLSQCLFSSWADTDTNSTGRLADPRSFCIQKTLQDIANGGPIENNLMFADRKSVVQGKSVSFRLDIGGRRIIIKYNRNIIYILVLINKMLIFFY